MLKKDGEVEIVEADFQPFHTSHNYIEAHLYQYNVGPISLKETIEDSPIENCEDLTFGLFGPTKENDV